MLDAAPEQRHQAEYRSTGPGANPAKRVPWSQQLTDTEAAAFTTAAALRGWIPPDLDDRGTHTTHTTHGHAIRSLPRPLRGWAFPYQFNGSFGLYARGTTNFNPTFDRACQDADAQADRGIAVLGWAYCWDRPIGENERKDHRCRGPDCTVANRSEIVEVFAAYGSVNHSATGMSAAVLGRGLDECNIANTQAADEKELAAAGFRLAKKRHPETLIAAWGANAGDAEFAALMADGTFDLAMIEGYTYCAGCGDWPASGSCCPVGPIEDALGQYRDRLEYAKSQGYLDRTVFCFGFILARSAINPAGWTTASLRAAMLALRTAYPELAGVIMYGMPPHRGFPNATTHSTPATDQATENLIKDAGALMLELWPDDSEVVGA